eukprot:scaffold50988_cov80-Cyclotella_meneghiniana.AAC.1
MRKMFGASAMARSHAGLNHHSDWAAICASIAAYDGLSSVVLLADGVVVASLAIDDLFSACC